MDLGRFLPGRTKPRKGSDDEVQVALLEEKEHGDFSFEKWGKNNPSHPYLHLQQHKIGAESSSSSSSPSSSSTLRSVLYCTLAVAALILPIFQLTNFRPFRSCGISSESPNPGPDDMSYAIDSFSCLPTQPCWPSSNEWGAFNQSLGGKLHVTIPWAAPCYSNSTSPECLHVRKRYMDGKSRTEQYGSFEYLDWETCGDSNCLLSSFSTHEGSPIMSGECGLGRLSQYYVEAHEADDIVKTLNFVRKHKLRFSIKNTGHDYFGRSNSANSLALWTHKMKDMKIHKTYTPKGCKEQYTNVGEIGAGVQAEDAYTFFDGVGMHVTVGAVGSVGIAGGFGQGGGHGPLTPTYGLMVDNAIEFDVVTADGKFRTINEYSDPDLFWAMRGGGGGTYAVLVNYRFQAHPAVPLNVYHFEAKFNFPGIPKPNPDNFEISKSRLHRDIVTALAANQKNLSEYSIAGYNFLHPDHMVILLIMPSKDPFGMEKVTALLHDFLSSYPGLEITNNTYHIFETYSDWAKFTQHPSIAKNGGVGIGLAEASRLVDNLFFEREHYRKQLVDAVIDAMDISYKGGAGGMVQLYATTPVYHPNNEKTGVNPRWRNSLWHVITAGVWVKDMSASDRRLVRNTVSASIGPIRSLTSGGGCYFNEGDYTEPDWKRVFFGKNYDRLLEVKKRYDPESLFNCYKCVGWTGDADPAYSCYERGGLTPVPSYPLKQN